MLCAKFGWNWSSGSGEEDENVKSLQTDRQTDRQTDGRTDGQTDRQTPDDSWSEKLTWAFSSGELKSVNLHLNKFYLSKHVLCNVWWKFALWFWRRRSLKVVNINFLISILCPLKKEGAHHCNKFESPLHKDTLCQVRLKLT